jgi:hypothetical protein
MFRSKFITPISNLANESSRFEHVTKSTAKLIALLSEDSNSQFYLSNSASSRASYRNCDNKVRRATPPSIQ